ncbi:malto-oligosyltrehalose trehalohydrolase [Cereibacter changlensis JA139]|uniref:Malto-oligosyltrehalose trehalohydrolase n=2 Tax=Cereibacter changlensis TaxID=402884 RepID=A0A2T4JQ45_9RHOB|nr:malto-oligosyltrehalose trehalohydrolase [Cereibacter changlensis]PTE20050.1 malto-oligosyltrehalose trehalohydrolase [Cereibacter changlensis JA139]PZX51767.1 maltooligosyl trehalose hydrolase [Cereibacter changlensis]
MTSGEGPQSICAWGAVLTTEGARFRIWAPSQQQVRLRLQGQDHAMERSDDGWFDLTLPAEAGAEYGFVLDDGRVVADPASRQQSGDVHGLSLVTDPAYHWQCDWRGRPWHESVILELHVGTFTPEGTFRAAIDRLADVAASGFTMVELMPVAQFAGNRGWGYDGVLLYAPHPAYGTPDDLRAFVDAAHGQGLSVVLDVVYNHFGPEGNYLPSYAPNFFDEKRHTPWGNAIEYHRPPVRRFFIDNAVYWLRDFRFDGLRIDAADHIRDPDSDPEFLIDMVRTIRQTLPGREIHLTTEDNRNITHLHERGQGGEVELYTGEWNDDLHNVAHVIATGESEAYYKDFVEDHWTKYARALAEGFAYQGEPSPFDGGKPRGAPSAHLPPVCFVDFLQNHDQIGNRAFGERLTTLAPERRLRLLMAMLLLSPHIPLMFMGEDWGETRPFTFFTDFEGELADAVREGRRKEFEHFAAFQNLDLAATVPDPNSKGTFESSRIDWMHRDTARGTDWLDFTRSLLQVRHAEIVPHLARAPGHGGKVLMASEDKVAVDWQLDGAILRLRANFDDREAALPAADGRVIYATTGASDVGAMPPGTVIATLQETT